MPTLKPHQTVTVNESKVTPVFWMFMMLLMPQFTHTKQHKQHWKCYQFGNLLQKHFLN